MRGRARNLDSPADELLSICIRRATIDSFWARERSTVSSNLWLAKRHLADQEALGSELEAMSSRGPYPQANVWGMNIVCGILICSLDKGRNALNILFSNVMHTCANGVGPSFVSDNGTSSTTVYQTRLQTVCSSKGS